MRKFILLTVAMLTLHSMHAQIVPGGIYGGLSGNYRFARYNALGYRPEITIGISDRSTLGVFMERNHFTGALDYNGIRHNRLDVSSGINYNYLHYFGKSRRWGWMLNNTLSYTHIRFYEKSPGTQVLTSSVNEYRLSVSPGIFYKASENLTLFARFGELSINRQSGGYPIMFRGYQEFRVGLLWNFGTIFKKKRR